MCKSLLCGTGFEGTKASWRAADAWHHGKLGEATRRCAASVEVEVPSLKGSWREAEACHYVAGSESSK